VNELYIGILKFILSEYKLSIGKRIITLEVERERYYDNTKGLSEHICESYRLKQ
jgi:hypothetical protein